MHLLNSFLYLYLNLKPCSFQFRSTNPFIQKKMESVATTKPLTGPGCGNEACVCGKKCGCPFGACSCEPDEAEEEEVETTMEIDLESKETVVNINIGVLGHVNSGKTSLVRALSRTLSTAALDKNPQSKERGMTLDLGFSSFAIQAPNANFKGICDKLQYTLVDCPGHASLIKTIINGAQIIDRMLLVIDVTKGIQLQTAECLILGEILTSDMIIVLNKIDLLVPVETRAEQIVKVVKQLRKTLASTPFADSPMIPIAANVDGGDENPTKVLDGAPLSTHNLVDLVRAIRDTSVPPKRLQIDSPLLFAVDHCFLIKGQGTVLTGTVMTGQARVGDDIEIPDLGIVRKIKTIQRFHRSVAQVSQGDRCSFAVSQLDAKRVERCIVCQPKSVPSGQCILALVRKVRYFDTQCVSGSKVHLTVGPHTGLARVTFFGSNELKQEARTLLGQRLPLDCLPLLYLNEYEFDGELKTGGKQAGGPVLQFVLLEFDQPVVCPLQVQLIGSRLDLTNDSQAATTCRIAFYGRVCKVLPTSKDAALRLFKPKEKQGVVDRVNGTNEVIGRGLFKRDTDISVFFNLKVSVRTKSDDNDVEAAEEEGVLESSFGKTGKFKVVFRQGPTNAKPGDIITLKFKKYVVGPGNAGGDSNKKLVQ